MLTFENTEEGRTLAWQYQTSFVLGECSRDKCSRLICVHWSKPFNEDSQQIGNITPHGEVLRSQMPHPCAGVIDRNTDSIRSGGSH